MGLAGTMNLTALVKIATDRLLLRKLGIFKHNDEFGCWR